MIQNSYKDQKRKRLKQHRNKVQKEIQKMVKSEKERKEIEKLKEIENSKCDSRRMFKALNILHKKTSADICIKKDDRAVNSTTEKIEIITEYFKTVFKKETAQDVPPFIPQKLDNPFTLEEIGSAIRKLKNNKSAGCDKLRAEHLKAAPIEIHKEIVALLNNICETGEIPKEIKLGLLAPLPKPGKEKGPAKNLRPVILLSILRKIIAICLINRVSDKIFNNIIPIHQCAYRPGRSATELTFSFKMLAEKAITSEDYTIHLLLLDMSKAFDTIDRANLMQDLNETLDKDELILVNLLIRDVQLAIKVNGKVGTAFTTNIGSPQGDSASAIFFISYLAKSKKVEPHLTFDHYGRLQFLLQQEYADDISFAATNIGDIYRIEEETTTELTRRNLTINREKTERYTIERGGNDKWKTCKLTGSLLGTAEDIKRRKQLANAAFSKFRSTLTSKRLSTSTKIRILRAVIESIFLYNAELWGLTKQQENEIDSFQRTLLRNTLNIRYSLGNWISNEKLYRITRTSPWSMEIKRRRLSFFGHACRLPDDAPAKRTIFEAERKEKKPKGGQKTTLLSTIKKDLKELGIKTIQEGMCKAQNRKKWNNLAVACCRYDGEA